MLLEIPNPKDPQDAEVAKMMIEDPVAFADKAHEWAIKYAGAPRSNKPFKNYQKTSAPEPKKDDPSRCVARSLCAISVMATGRSMSKTDGEELHADIKDTIKI
jgi:hypothetical protein